MHCNALFNIFRVDYVRLLRFSSFSSYLTENSLSQLLLLDRPLFLRLQLVSHTEGSLSTLQRQMTSMYVGIRIKNTEFRQVPSLRKVGYTWCQQGPETNARASKMWHFCAKPWLLISHNHQRRALDQTLQPGIKTAIFWSKTQRLDSTEEISLRALFGKFKTYHFFTSTASLFRNGTS